MPRYFFNIIKPDASVVADEEGLELEDDEVARREGAASLRDLLAESLAGDLMPTHMTVEIVKDGAGVLTRFTGRIDIPSES